jgi:signal transduction histidine kinase
VDDAGPGIPPAERARVGALPSSERDRARRAPARAWVPPSCAIVLLHGGRVAIDEAPNGGARVELTLPLDGDLLS